MVSNLKPECSFTSWYPQFCKYALKAVMIPIPENIVQYLENDAFLLPLEVSKSLPEDAKWADGLPVADEETDECQPTFPEFSQKIQDVIDEYGAVFVKSNWSSPSDAVWVAPTKTLICKTLEEIYLLLKSSDKIATDLQTVKSLANNGNPLHCCLVLKQWYDINPCTEFRCFVVEKELVGISQRDISQYHSYNESEKYNIQTDIKSLFNERIKDKFELNNYSFDVVRYKKDKVKIVDFGPLDQSVTKGTLFTYEELQTCIRNTPEFRFIGEEIGIQPKATTAFCIPQEINDFFQSSNNTAFLDVIQKEVENQHKEHETRDADELENM
ncbi:hypothetical protein KM043_014398 [Ampulex compressa]|nr:hypothetical protein KM043_014398 [Ampulex compressa]